MALCQCFSTPSPRTQMSPRKALAESASTRDMQASAMPSDNNNFAVSHDIYTFDVSLSWKFLSKLQFVFAALVHNC